MTHQPIDKPSRGRVKAEFPQKICPTCNRSFAWRNKWACNSYSVRYCSERCRRGKTRLQGDVP